MKKLALFAFLASATLGSAVVADLEDVPVPSSGFLNDSLGFTSRGMGFNNTFDSTFGSWAGFAASTVNAPTTPGFGNQYAAKPGLGAGGSATYGVGYVDSFSGVVPTLSLGFDQVIRGAYVTNTAYAYYSMRDGDSFAKKFGGATGNDADWFLLTATGFSGSTITGTAELYLADYRFADNSQDFLCAEWTWFDLSALGSATSVQFTLSSSDTGGFGMNTPAYFAIDNVQAVPEPGTWVALGLGALLLRRRGRQ